MIEEQVKVVAVENGQLLLEAQTKSACGSCDARKGCGTSVLSKVIGKKFTRFSVKNTINAQVGDTVIVGLPERALLGGSVMVYLLPVTIMLLAALLAEVLMRPTVPGRDILVAASSFAGLISGMLFTRRYFSSDRSRTAYTPVILRKVIL